MNYIDITKSNEILKFNINHEGRGDGVVFYIYKEGSDSLVVDFSGEIIDKGYWQYIDLTSSLDLADLQDETQYSLVAIDANEKVVYRGKFQTTSKDISNYSINKNKYAQKTNTNDYTILD